MARVFQKKKKKSTKPVQKKKNCACDTASKHEHVCMKCPAYCCHDLCMYITKPTNQADIDELKWYLHYTHVKICIRNHRWYILFHDKCMYLGDDSLCTIYDTRSERCRRHQPPECEYYDKWYHLMFSTPDELEAYIEKEKKRKKKQRQALLRKK